jgi:amidophosphoribosyltransferase
MAGELHEKCAVAAVQLPDDDPTAAAYVYESLYAMQHRGVEASGIATIDGDGMICEYRHPGLVRDVFNAEIMHRLTGAIALGHNRYSTNGSKFEHLQPVIDPQIMLAFAHNGNIPDTSRMERYLKRHHLHYENANDSEMMAMVIGQRLRNGKDLPTSIEKAYPLFRGAFSCVAAHGDTLVAFRSPYGIRPLALGKFATGHAVSSETCGLDIIGAEFIREVRPGEMVIISRDGSMESRQVAPGTEKLDMFELVYFARHDSYLYGKRVNEVRRDFGRQLANEHAPKLDGDATIVVPVPDTSVPIAEGYAEALDLPTRQAIIKNRYIGRTFIQPSQNGRVQDLHRKHTLITEAFAGKDVILIDDSIVRKNTMPNLVKQARAAGARSVTVLIGSPPIRFPDFYGIDTPSQNELAAANMTIAEMQADIGCDYLGFLSLDGMVKATGLPHEMFNLSSFNGEYPIDIGKKNRRSIRVPVSMEFAE